MLALGPDGYRHNKTATGLRRGQESAGSPSAGPAPSGPCTEESCFR